MEKREKGRNENKKSIQRTLFKKRRDRKGKHGEG